jgi:phosphohistidine swiveling domain-containing protein
MEEHDAMIIALDVAVAPAVEMVGGKAASLFALASRGFRVPPFFVLTASAYRARVDGRIPDELKIAVRRSWDALGGDAHEYAVRSSGLAEDSADFSYAGVFETVLDVRGFDRLVAAIEHCWASHQSAIAAAYRAKRKITDDAAMAVVVQKMVRAEWAGVSFSADPLTQALSVCVINAVRGLGDKLVSGLINPEEIRVDARSGRMIERHASPDAEAIPDGLRDEVVRQTRLAGESFEFPQDVEWAVENNTLYLLQSRPITTVTGVFYNRALEPWGMQGNPDAPDRVWTRAYADEVWAPPLTPLFYDIQNLTVVTGQQLANAGDTAPVPTDVFKYFRAAAYMDVAVLERLFATLPPIARRPSLLPLLDAERRAALLKAPWNWRGTLARLWKFEVRKGRTFGLARNHRFLAAAWPGFLSVARTLCDVELPTLTDAQLDEHLAHVWQLAISVAPQCEVAVLYYAQDLRLFLSGLLERWCTVGDRLYAEVSAGLEHSESVRETDAIWALARAVRALGPAVVDAANSLDWKSFRGKAATLEAQSIVAGFEDFLRSHRHRGANYKDLIYPRWGDDPQLLWAHVRAFIAGDVTRPSEANARGGARRRESQRAALVAQRGPFAPLKRRVLRVLFRWNELYSGLRDNHRFYYDYVWYLVRGVYQEKGRRLRTAGLLADAGDIMFLVRAEIDALREGILPPAMASTRISVRRREWHETRAKLPPRFLRRGYVSDEGDAAERKAGPELVGLAASPGTVRGIARVVMDVADLARVADGEILIARQTDPGWTPAFARLAALVLETGGVLAHGASLCREYGLPCVTAINGATVLIVDGDFISVNGAAGTVEILRRGQDPAAGAKNYPFV